MTYLVLPLPVNQLIRKKDFMMIAGYAGDECCARVVWPVCFVSLLSQQSPRLRTFSFTPFPEPSRMRALWILSGKTIPIMNANFAPSRNTFKTKNVLPPPRQHASARSGGFEYSNVLAVESFKGGIRTQVFVDYSRAQQECKEPWWRQKAIPDSCDKNNEGLITLSGSGGAVDTSSVNEGAFMFQCRIPGLAVSQKGMFLGDIMPRDGVATIPNINFLSPCWISMDHYHTNDTDVAADFAKNEFLDLIHPLV
ncbi:hypothetical protein CPB85DRAFT_1256891 [Mucidula mucida]|nr:hypothetical protein CPB85DRAFT_1256891 [Mucidula mucida]